MYFFYLDWNNFLKLLCWCSLHFGQRSNIILSITCLATFTLFSAAVLKGVHNTHTTFPFLSWHTHSHKTQPSKYNFNVIIQSELYLDSSACWNHLPVTLLQMNGVQSSEFVHCCVAWKAKSWFNTIGWFGALTTPGSMLTSLMAPKAF